MPDHLAVGLNGHSRKGAGVNSSSADIRVAQEHLQMRYWHAFIE